MTETILEIKNLKKSYGKNEVLKDISLSVKKGEVISIIGSSGSGKSTFLRSINLLESPSGGEILYHGDNVLEKGYDLTTYRERLGMVFQSFNLFENLNVLENAIVAHSHFPELPPHWSWFHYHFAKRGYPSLSVLSFYCGQ